MDIGQVILRNKIKIDCSNNYIHGEENHVKKFISNIFEFIKFFIIIIIANTLSDYLVPSIERLFSLETGFKFLIYVFTFLIIQFLFSKIQNAWRSKQS